MPALVGPHRGSPHAVPKRPPTCRGGQRNVRVAQHGSRFLEEADEEGAEALLGPAGSRTKGLSQLSAEWQRANAWGKKALGNYPLESWMALCMATHHLELNCTAIHFLKGLECVCVVVPLG